MAETETVKKGTKANSKSKFQEIVEKLQEFFTGGKLIAAIVVLAIIAWVTYSTIQGNIRAQQNQREIEEILASEQASDTATEAPTLGDGFDAAGIDELLIEQQPNLEERYGTPPDNFVWDTNGDLLSLGDRDMSAEDVVYTYLRALSTLDFNVVQMFTLRSSVYNTYSGFYESAAAVSSDARSRYDRDMYRLMLTTMQVDSIQASSVFADNRQVFTVSAQILDLTNKDFWLDDFDAIMTNLNTYNNDEEDQNKADEYLYGYVVDYYGSMDAVYRNVTFDVTLTRSVDLNTGWLVTIDSDLNTLMKNQDGVQVVTDIKNQFRQWSLDQTTY